MRISEWGMQNEVMRHEKAESSRFNAESSVVRGWRLKGVIFLFPPQSTNKRINQSTKTNSAITTI